MAANQLGRRNLTPDAFKLLLGRRYNRVKKANGERGPQKLAQNDPASTADRLAAQHGVSPATVKRAELALELEAEVKAGARERQLSTLKQNTDVQNSALRDDTGRSRDAIAKIAGKSAGERMQSDEHRGWGTFQIGLLWGYFLAVCQMGYRQDTV